MAAGVDRYLDAAGDRPQLDVALSGRAHLDVAAHRLCARFLADPADLDPAALRVRPAAAAAAPHLQVAADAADVDIAVGLVHLDVCPETVPTETFVPSGTMILRFVDLVRVSATRSSSETSIRWSAGSISISRTSSASTSMRAETESTRRRAPSESGIRVPIATLV